MARTVIVNELDRPLAEARAIMFAMREGFPKVEVLKMVRVKGAWEVHVDLHASVRQRKPKPHTSL